MTINKKLSSVLALSVGLFAASLTSMASATVSCVPTRVAVNPGNSNKLRVDVQCNGTWYHSDASECSVTVDQVKTFTSIAQSAILSGKTLQINNGSTCGGTTRFDWMELDL